MLSSEGCAARRRRLWDAVAPACDALIVGDPQHLIYFANYAPSPFVFRTSDAGALLLLEPGRATLLADSMVRPYLDRAYADEVVAPVWYSGKSAAPSRRWLLVRTAIDRLSKVPGRRIGVEMGSVPAGVVESLKGSRPGLELVDLDPIVRPLRRAKDDDELAVLNRSMRAIEAGQAAALKAVAPGMTEQEVYRLVQEASQAALDEQVLIYGDFASGPRCETERGGPPTSRTIRGGDLFLLDYSVVVHGYRGDFTNTFVVGGEPTKRQAELFDACMTALAAGEAQLRPGNPARAVDEAIRASLAPLGLEQYYLSHSGHGLGLSHPEPPYLVPESDETLLAGDVVAVEPGLYVPGVGGMRFERNYRITDGGFETLSNHELTLRQS